MTNLTATVEFHPENGACPWVAVLRGGPFEELWLAYSREETANKKAADALAMRKSQATIARELTMRS